MATPNNNWYLDPGLAYPSFDLDLPFAQYIKRCQNLIQQTRCDLTGGNRDDTIIAANSPFELLPAAIKRPTRYGALLIHGLYDSPFVMRELAVTLQEQGILSRSVLLPGHGTVPGALLQTTYQEWIQTVHYGVTRLQHVVDKIFLVGFSTGGILAIHHALSNPLANIAGIVALAPALQISPLAAYAGWLTKLGRQWLHQEPEIDYAKYRSFTYQSVAQIHGLAQLTNKLVQQRPLRVPQFIVISEKDETVASAPTLTYFTRFAALTSEMIIYTKQSQRQTQTRVTARPAVYPELNIEDVAHIALPIAPNNPHYGGQGDFALASLAQDKIVPRHKVLYGTYNTIESRCLNLLQKSGIIKYERRRLTYNPDYAYMRQRLKSFIEKIISSV